jgi:hypothetical protein
MARPIFAGLIACGFALSIGGTLAQTATQTPPGSAGANVPPPTGNRTGDTVQPMGRQFLSEEQIRDRLRLEGYEQITEMELLGVNYQAKAVKDGKSLNLTVDAATGSVRSAY